MSASARAVMIHEFGHSFGGLMDEYDYGISYGTPWAPNCDYAGCASWKDVSGVGCYAVCSYANLFKPTPEMCRMADLYYDFCPVCAKQLNKLLKMYAMLQPIPDMDVPSIVILLLSFCGLVFSPYIVLHLKK